MRKFIALGLSALTAGTIVVGTAVSPAAAQTEPILDGVCAGVEAQVVTSLASVNVATIGLNTANTELAEARSNLDAAIVAWIQAFVGHIEAVDAEGNTAVTQAILDAAVADVLDAVGPWGQAKISVFNAQHELDLAEMVHLMSTTLQGECPAPVL